MQFDHRHLMRLAEFERCRAVLGLGLGFWVRISPKRWMFSLLFVVCCVGGHCDGLNHTFSGVLPGVCVSSLCVM